MALGKLINFPETLVFYPSKWAIILLTKWLGFIRKYM